MGSLLSILISLAALTVTGGLYMKFRRDLILFEKQRQENMAALEQRWKASVEALERERRQFIVQPGPAPATNGLNLTKRSQVLQLHRRGETPQQIALALGVPRNEIELLIKVQQIVLANL